MKEVDYEHVSSMFNLPPAITAQANDELVEIIKQSPKPKELSPLDMLISPEDVSAILSENEGA